MKILFLSVLSLLVSVTPLLADQSSGSSNAPAAHKGFAGVEGKNIVAADGKPLLLRGINLGNWLLPEGYMFKLEQTTAHWQIAQLFKELVGPAEALAFWQEWYDGYITRDDIQYIKNLGLNSIRVPFNYKLLTPEDYPGVWLGPGFDLLDRVIAWSKEAGLYVILDMHAAPGGQTGTNIDDSVGHPWLFESQACQQRTVEIWRKIAERYGEEETVLGYDLLNEPIPHFEGYERFFPLLEPLYKRIVTAIREVDANHIIFLGGAVWNTNFDVFGPPFADNLAYTFHKYWMEPVQREIQPFLNFRDRHDVPVWMGESGENKDEWVASYRQLLERNNVGWCFWPFKKMDSQSCIRTFDVPPFWDQVAAYARQRNLDPGKIKDFRPPIEHSRQALEGLLRNIRFEHNRVNDGYIKALGF